MRSEREVGETRGSGEIGRRRLGSNFFPPSVIVLDFVFTLLLR